MGRTKKCVAIMTIFGVIWTVPGIIGGIIRGDMQFTAMWGTIGIIFWFTATIGVCWLMKRENAV